MSEAKDFGRMAQATAESLDRRSEAEHHEFESHMGTSACFQCGQSRSQPIHKVELGATSPFPDMIPSTTASSKDVVVNQFKDFLAEQMEDPEFAEAYETISKEMDKELSEAVNQPAPERIWIQSNGETAGDYCAGAQVFSEKPHGNSVGYVLEDIALDRAIEIVKSVDPYYRSTSPRVGKGYATGDRKGEDVRKEIIAALKAERGK